MKKLVLTLLLLALFFSFSPKALASDGGLDVSGVTESLSEEARGVGGTLTLDGSYDAGGALSRLWGKLLDRIVSSLRESAAPAAGLLAVSMLSAVACSLCPEARTSSLIQASAAAAASLTLLSGIDSLTTQAVDTLSQLLDYSRAALPAVFTAAAATGAVVTASARYAAACLALDVLMTASRRVTLPLIYAFLAVSISGGVFPHPLLRMASRLLKKLATLVMTGLTTAFTFYLGLTGLVTGSADAVAVKTAKTVISGVLPVVGGILSDAASAVLSAASLIKNSAGSFALVAVCALCAGPFAALGVRMLLFRAAAAAAELAPGDRLPALLGDLSAAMGMLLGLVGSFALMLFFSILAAIRVVSA